MDDKRPMEAAERFDLDVNRVDGDIVFVHKLDDAFRATTLRDATRSVRRQHRPRPGTGPLRYSTAALLRVNNRRNHAILLN